MTVDMNDIVGSHNILFICLDTLRYDVAIMEQENGGTHILNKYGKWRKCQAAGNFTYPSQQAMFAGFLPIDEEIHDMKKREILFFSPDIGMGRKTPKGALLLKKPTWIEELADRGYETYCIGGVGFFNKRTPIGSVMPAYFKYSYWHPSFGCKVRESTANQVNLALSILQKINMQQRIMLYINISALHYPNYFYVSGEKQDSIKTQAAALRYADKELGRLFEGFKRLGDTFVICCSDHGTCYGEDGIRYHGINHPIVNTVPYKHFIMKGNGSL